jgi:hypothetical protein
MYPVHEIIDLREQMIIFVVNISYSFFFRRVWINIQYDYSVFVEHNSTTSGFNRIRFQPVPVPKLCVSVMRRRPNRTFCSSQVDRRPRKLSSSSAKAFPSRRSSCFSADPLFLSRDGSHRNNVGERLLIL